MESFQKYKKIKALGDEENKDYFGKGKKQCENDDEKICSLYCTNARIDKHIFKLVDEGYKLEMKLMEVLPKRVIEDIYEEHWREILHSNMSLDLKNTRKLITKRCLSVLKQVITNNALNGGE